MAYVERGSRQSDVSGLGSGVEVRQGATHIAEGRKVWHLAPGDFVNSSIRLIRLLEEGGMGSVWVAEHLTLHTEVVVKFITGEYAQHPEALARFEREAALTAQARSQHVVQVFDHGVAQNGLPYVAMEYLEGEDLAARIQREGKIAPEPLVDWLRQAASGLSRAHAKGIVHRDIKPENIFLCNEDGEVLVKLLDFGIAKSDQRRIPFSGTQTGAVLGTVFYMSPEQTMGAKHIDLRTDLWSLGVVAYHALTGVRPFDRDALGPMVAAITSDPIPPPSYYEPSLTPAIDAWVAKALARAPEERFQSAKEMAIAFGEAVFGTAYTRRASGDFQSMPGQTSEFALAPAVTTIRSGTGSRTSAERRVWTVVAAMIGAVAAVVGFVVYLIVTHDEPTMRAEDAPEIIESDALASPEPQPRIGTPVDEPWEQENEPTTIETEPASEPSDDTSSGKAEAPGALPAPQPAATAAPKRAAPRPTSSSPQQGSPALRMDLE